MASSSREVFKKILDTKSKDIDKRVFEWGKAAFKNKQPLEHRDRIYLIFGEITKNKLPRSLYVGKTRQTLNARYSQHMQEVRAMLEGKRNWTVKGKWIYEMILREQNVRIILLNKVPRSKAYIAENEWIYYLGLHNFNMINKANFMHYSKKVYVVN